MTELTLLQKAVKAICQQKVYLGDSVYVKYDGYHIILTTENGLPGDPSNEIALEPAVYHNLVEYKENLFAEVRALKERDEETRKEDEKMLPPIL